MGPSLLRHDALVQRLELLAHPSERVPRCNKVLRAGCGGVLVARLQLEVVMWALNFYGCAGWYATDKLLQLPMQDDYTWFEALVGSGVYGDLRFEACW